MAADPVAVQRARAQAQKGRQLARAHVLPGVVAHAAVSLQDALRDLLVPGRHGPDRPDFLRARGPLHPGARLVHGGEPGRAATAQPAHEGRIAAHFPAKFRGLGPGDRQERVDLAPEAGPDGLEPHEGQQPVGGIQARRAASATKEGSRSAASPNPVRVMPRRWMKASMACRSDVSKRVMTSNVCGTSGLDNMFWY